MLNDNPSAPTGQPPFQGGQKPPLEGEVSPKATEGLAPPLHKILDIHTNCFKIFCDVKIRVA